MVVRQEREAHVTLHGGHQLLREHLHPLTCFLGGAQGKLARLTNPAAPRDGRAARSAQGTGRARCGRAGPFRGRRGAGGGRGIPATRARGPARPCGPAAPRHVAGGDPTHAPFHGTFADSGSARARGPARPCGPAAPRHVAGGDPTHAPFHGTFADTVSACPRKRRLVGCCAMVKPVRPDGRASKIRLRKPIRDPGCEARKPPAAYWPRAAQSSSARPPRPAPPAQPPHHPRARRPPHRRTRPQRVDHGLRSHCRRLRLRPPVSQAAKTAGSEGRKRALAMACSVLANSCGPKVPDGQQGRLLEVVRPRPRPHPS